MKNDKIFSFLDIIIIVFVTSIIMYFLGAILVYRHLGGVNYSVLAKDEKLKEFISAYSELTEKYYDSLDKSKLIDGAINGMYSKVDDPYTNYMDSKTTTYLNESLSGKYRGIGIRMMVQKDGSCLITEVFDDSPAKNAGLLAGDIITKVNGEDVKNKSGNEIAGLIKKGDNSVSVSVSRGQSSYEYNMDIKELLNPVVSSKLLEKNDHKVGYLGLAVFNDTADTQFETALSSLENSGMESLIIDLRDNTGGYLDVANNIAEIFIEKDKIIYSLENKNSKSDYRDKTNEKRNYKVYILLNKSSASASEILAAALKYSYGANLVGEQSYGKGKVQERASLTNGNTVKYTTAKWLTPNGDCIDGIGLSPDYPVAFDQSQYVTDDIYSDSQVLYILNNLVD